MRATPSGSGPWLAGIVACVLLGTGASAAPPKTFQGKPLAVWLDAMLFDLDADYRRSARDAVSRFGADALPRLAEIIEKHEGPEGVALATGALIRMGPPGRAIVARRLAEGLHSPNRSAHTKLFHVIRGIGDAGALARPFVPHLRTLANSPDVSLIALRVLSQAESAGADRPDEAISDLEARGAGVTVSLTPHDCFVENRFAAIHARVLVSPGATIKRALVIFSTAHGEERYFVPAHPIGSTEGGRQAYEGILPKPILGATTVAYRVMVETTNMASVTTEEVVGGVSPTEEGCALIGATPAPEARPTKPLEVFAYKPR